jgi:hypothetical protein
MPSASASLQNEWLHEFMKSISVYENLLMLIDDQLIAGKYI